MIETDRVLRPLREAERAIDQLASYESPAALTEALRATWHAVDRTLRTLLRSDTTAPEHIRMTALSPEQMPADTVMAELRRRDLVSIGLAGRVHGLRQAVERTATGDVRAADADNALEVVRCVTDEVHEAAHRTSPDRAADDDAIARGAGTPQANPGVGPAVPPGGSDGPLARGGRFGSRVEHVRPLAIGAVAIALLIMGVIAVLLLGGRSEMELGIAAFGDGRTAQAEQHFRTVLQEDEANNTARLYLARLLRRDARHQEAADLLRAANARDPEDPAVLRELGWLFLDLDRPEFAARQFQSAIELEPAEPLNWVGVVEAMNRSGDTAGSAEWLRRAPEEARDLIRSAR